MRWLSLGLAFGLLGAGVAWALENGWLTLQEPSQEAFPVQGLDVSHHQGVIDWPRVARDGRFRFVWIKATEGGDFVDPRFAINWREAGSAGFVVGAYHFFTLCRPGTEQAENLLSVLPEVDGATLPVAVDLELGGNCGARPSRTAFASELGAFLEAVERRTGRPSVLYTTFEFHEAYLTGADLDARPWWVRSVFTRPGPLDGQPWHVWQYLPRGRVDGIEGVVDQNAFAGDAAAFATFVRPVSRPPGARPPGGSPAP
ncbi:MAG: GH25 family lysozyme [Myxococcota bacterium]